MGFPQRNILYLDTEATIYETGNPFSKPNRLMCVGCVFDNDYFYFDIEHSGLPYNEHLKQLSQLLNKAELIVGFNIKYDLHWIRKYCPDVFPLVRQRVYCTQLGEFLLSHQRLPYPDLDTTLSYYGLHPKLDNVKLKYWDAGICTSKIPVEELQEYVKYDVISLPEIYKKQLSRFAPQQMALMELQCDDLVVLQEMEFNGMLFDREKSLKEADRVRSELETNKWELAEIVSNYDKINWDSPFHVSAVLYGGALKYKCRVKTSRTLKDGTVKEGEKTGEAVVRMPQLVKPLQGSALATEGYYSTAEPVLRSLRASGTAKKLIQLLLKQSELSKQIDTYYKGIPSLIDKMAWEFYLHGQFNQCVARTGRLSSSKPNLQNFDRRMKHLFPSRFK